MIREVALEEKEFLDLLIEKPSHKCLVCDCLEYPKAEIVFTTDKAWLCKKCKAALLKVVERSENEPEQRTDI